MSSEEKFPKPKGTNPTEIVKAEIAAASAAEYARVRLAASAAGETLTPAQREYLEKEQRDYAEASTIPKRLPVVRIRERPRTTDMTTPAVPVVPTVTEADRVAAEEELIAATDEQANLARLIESSQAELEASALRVAKARALHEERRVAAARSASVSELEPQIQALKVQHDKILSVFDTYDGALKRMAQSCASGPTSRERMKLQDLYTQAGPLRHQLGLAFKACQAAQTAIERALKFSDSLWKEQALAAIAAALKLDPSAVADRAEQIIRESGILGKPSSAPPTSASWRRPPEPGPTVITGWNPHASNEENRNSR